MSFQQELDKILGPFHYKDCPYCHLDTGGGNAWCDGQRKKSREAITKLIENKIIGKNLPEKPTRADYWERTNHNKLRVRQRRRLRE